MANNENLIPKDSNQSREEAERNGRKGGKRSGEVKREKKSIKQGFEIVLGILTEKTLKEATAKDSKDGSIEMLKDGGYLPYKLARMLTDKSIKNETKLKVIQEMIDRIEGKAIQTVYQGEIEVQIDEIDEQIMKESAMKKYNLVEKE